MQLSLTLQDDSSFYNKINIGKTCIEEIFIEFILYFFNNEMLDNV